MKRYPTLSFHAKCKSDILQQLDEFKPDLYAETRNYTDGHLSYLSPYISRGVISTSEIADTLMRKGWHKKTLYKYIQELAWRDYFQLIYTMRPPKEAASEDTMQLPTKILQAQTGITGIDQGINNLLTTGYIHNHQRMYVAMLMGNILKVNPLHASKWFYYHLLDADIASNTLNWEWIISKKKYYANQENINRFCYTQQQGTFLDTTYEALPNLELGNEFTDQTDIFLHTELPPTDDGIDPSSENIFIYNNYHLDETWHHNQSGIRVLLLEPSHFSQYPVSPKSLEFIMSQSRCIPGIKIYTGSFASLQKRFAGGKLFFKEHPLNSHYVGQLEQRDRLFQDIQDYEPSFSSFWKKCLKYL